MIPPNQQLQNAREKAQWSVERVAFALNLPSYLVVALEEGNYGELKGEAFVVGHMRSYAELFDLDTAVIVEAYHHIKEEKEKAEQASIKELAMQKASQQHQKYKTGYGIAAAVTLMAALSMLTPSDNYHADSATAEAITLDTAIGTTVIDSLDGLPTNDPTADMLPKVVMQEDMTEKQVQAILKQRMLGEEQDLAALESDNSEINFKFSADCWVEVVDGDNKLIYASMQKSEETLQLTGKPPFRVTLGYAPGVSLSYNGEPVDISTEETNIVKLTLGNS